MPLVLNKHKHGVPLGAVYIGRPSKWGNPFEAGKDGTRIEVVEKHKAWVLANPLFITQIRRELHNKNLLCFCAPKPCHGDILLELANESDDAGLF